MPGLDSPLIEVVLIFFMPPVVLDVVMHFFVFRKKRLAPCRHDGTGPAAPGELPQVARHHPSHPAGETPARAAPRQFQADADRQRFRLCQCRFQHQADLPAGMDAVPFWRRRGLPLDQWPGSRSCDSPALPGASGAGKIAPFAPVPAMTEA
ncbi:MAG TPA: hypothetical protein PKC12_07715 [Thiobacillaceae bacterium]|nr:hypothetical protein [Thiobacillaceae bacterium]